MTAKVAMKKSYPIALASGPVSLQTLGASVQANSGQLTSPFRTALLAREIRFSVGFPSAATVDAAGLFIQARMRIGKWDLCPGFVPLASFCPETQLIVEQSAGLFQDAAGNNFNYSMLRWRFPRPMYIPPGDGLSVALQRVTTDHGDTGSTSGVNVEVSIAGTALDPESPPPKTTCVPYVSAYKLATTTAAPAGASGEADLRNPFLVPFNVQRLIGRYYNDATTSFTTAAGAKKTDALVRLTDSHRLPITPPYYLRFGEVFDGRSRTLEYRSVLNPRDWITADLRNGPNKDTFWISMIGYREEPLP